MRSQQRFGCYELTAAVAAGLMREWEPPQREGASWTHVRQWAVTQTEKTINHPVLHQWHRLLRTVDPTVLAVHRAIFAATLGAAEVATCPELYRHPYLVRDILHHRAAACAVRDVDLLGDRARLKKVTSSPHAAALKALAEELGVRVEIVAGHPPFDFFDDGPHDESTDADRIGRALENLHEWRGLFSPTGRPYRSLNRTLMQLPGGIPHGLVCELQSIHLGRPLVDRAELLVATLLSANRRIGRTDRHRRVLADARAPQIREALGRVAAHTRNNLRFRRTRDLRFFVRFLLDCPEDHHGTIVGLSDKAIRWHQHQLASGRERLVELYGAATTVAAPPVAPPAGPIRRLATVEEIAIEGQRMGHCIASHIADAIAGRCYLFHVDHQGETASVLVDQQGGVVEAHGPGNQRNRAAAWGRRVLRQWGRELPPSPRRTRERRSVKHPEPSFASFCAAVRDLLDETASDKGYHRSGLAGPNPLYTFVAETAGGPGHALGEIVYKVRRYAARRNPEDLAKVAAWAYLVWRFDRSDVNRSDVSGYQQLGADETAAHRSEKER